MKPRRGQCVLACAALAVLLAGCTCVNEPDLSFLDVDASTGAGDGDGDGDLDGDSDGDGDGDGDGDITPEVCGELGTDVDEDRDGLTDCQDPECLDDPACCPGRGSVVDEAFDAGGWDTGEWAPLAESHPPLVDNLLHVDFTTDANGLVLRERVDLTYGLEVRFDVSAAAVPGSQPCETLAGCGDYVGLALTPVQQLTPGVPLPTTLLVAATAGGEVIVVHGDVIRQRIDLLVELSDWQTFETLGVQVDVLPGGTGGRRGFRVQVGPTADSAVDFDAWESEDLFLDESDNYGADGMPGAWLAVVGRTQNRSLATLEFDAELLGCDNPAVFVPSTDEPLTASSLGLGAWAQAFIGAPAIALVGASGHRLLFDASDVDLGLERYRAIPRAIGEAHRQGLEAWTAEDAPVIGVDPPSSTVITARDPAMLSNDPLIAWLAWDDGTTDGIALSNRQSMSAVWSEPTMLLATDHVEGVTAIRSPAVARSDTDFTEGVYHLWFIGVDLPGQTSLWHAVGDAGFGPASISGVEPILDADAFGPAAFRGISDPMVVWDMDRRVFLMWVLGEDALGRKSLLHAVLPADGASAQPYEGNPVLDSQDPVLGACDQGCNLRGGAVMAENGRRTFVLARSAGSESPVQELVTVTQPIGGDQ